MKTLHLNFINNTLIYGIIAGLLIIIIRATLYLFDIDLTNNISFAVINFMYNIIVLSICLYRGTIVYRKKTVSGKLTYRKGLFVCVTISFVTILLVYVYDIIFYVFITPNYLANMIEPQLSAIANNHSIPYIQKMELMHKLQKFLSPFYNTSMNALMSLGISVFLSLIVAVFTVRKRTRII